MYQTHEYRDKNTHVSVVELVYWRYQNTTIIYRTQHLIVANS